MLRGLLAACVACGLLACRAPQSLSSEARERLAAREAGGTPAFQEGFVEGARMVRNAMAAQRRPYHPVMGGARAFLPATDPTQAPVPAPRVEAHPRTGLPLKELGQGGPVEEGRIAGFTWALDALAKGRWEAGTLSTAPKEVPAFAEAERPGFRIWREGGTLLWTLGEGGFPPRLRWRQVPEAWGAEGAACEGPVLWLSTRVGLLALDPEEGWILAVLPALARPLTEAQREAAGEADHRRRVEAGDPEALREEAGRLGAEGLPPLQRAASLGAPAAKVDLALRYLHGTGGVTKDAAQAWSLIGEAARSGSAEAAALLEAHAKGEL